MIIHNTILMASISLQFDRSQLFWVLWWAIMCFWSGRSVGCTIDAENRDLGGKSYLIHLPSQYKWLFKSKKNMSYAEKNKILLASVIIQLLGYLFATIEILLLIYVVSFIKVESGAEIAVKIFVSYCLIAGIGVVMPNGIRYENNMRKTYDYDWVTYVQEIFSLNPKRRCYIVAHIKDAIYEIELGRWKKRKYLAEASVPVNVGENRYAIHVYGEGGPYWKIKNH